MNRVSDEDLESLTEWAASWAGPEDSHWSDVVKVVAELQSLRQASVAGVEEEAERIAKRISEYPHPVFAAPAIIRMELTALLAERDAVLLDCRPYVAGHGTLETLARIDAIIGKEGDDGS